MWESRWVVTQLIAESQKRNIIFNSASRLSLPASLPRERSLWLVQSLESGSSLMRPPGDNGFDDDDVVPDVGVVHD